MGLTIHYNLEFTGSEEQVLEILQKAKHKAENLAFENVDDIKNFDGLDIERILETREPKEDVWALIQAGGYVREKMKDGGQRHHDFNADKAMILSTWPGQGCEQANFGFCKYPDKIKIRKLDFKQVERSTRKKPNTWYWGSFCKTQYASNVSIQHFLRCHLSVCRMLDYFKELGVKVKVSDEGKFWKKRDLQALASEVGCWNTMIAGFSTAFDKGLQNSDGSIMESPIQEHPNFVSLVAESKSKLNKDNMDKMIHVLKNIPAAKTAEIT